MKEVQQLRGEALLVQDTDPQRYNELREQAKAVLRKNVHISSASTETALAHFGIGTNFDVINLAKLFDLWREGFSDEGELKIEEGDLKWFDLLMADVSRATQMHRSDPTPYHFKSAKSGQDLRPVIVKRTLERDGSMTYSLYLFKVFT